MHEVDYNWYVTSTTCPPSRFLIHISLNPMFHCNTRHSYNWNGLNPIWPGLFLEVPGPGGGGGGFKSFPLHKSESIHALDMKLGG